ncbi:ATP-binding protein [Streptomyces chrestomyceticus]|uniref:ATP-binding protein n=1 Tax=Streptomyces chrestomyceticus TaxID=68185 RepID=UPI001F497710|nr:ATP-binding protein [Streptomyces chrestomyceticus]
MTTHPAPTVRDARHAEAGTEQPATNLDAFAVCALSGAYSAVAEARRFTAATLEGWGVSAPVVSDAVLVVSELTGNALRHAVPRRPGAEEPRPDLMCAAWLALAHQDAGVLCAVSDSSRAVPVLAAPDLLAEEGRGLWIVDRLSESWGWTRPDDAGKTVWAQLPVPRPTR